MKNEKGNIQSLRRIESTINNKNNNVLTEVSKKVKTNKKEQKRERRTMTEKLRARNTENA